MSQFVTATFKTRSAAEDALHRLEAVGISDSQISIITTDSTRGANFNIETHNQVDQGVAGGATAGGLIGAGIPEYEAKIYDKEIRSGAILLAVEPRDSTQREQVKKILQLTDAHHLAA